ncbi:hypothetical protein PoB_002264700 [Plakobranchus ocellatus]|uniref:Uncharacterized protein n=1 Tax=Plakobranchus ocellatus TaxID=259542 RepID=A0AAV3ZNP2_9GAST|nr:hypothetical protein PoB_002264700 [Plakobranchus ocellatus]
MGSLRKIGAKVALGIPVSLCHYSSGTIWRRWLSGTQQRPTSMTHRFENRSNLSKWDAFIAYVFGDFKGLISPCHHFARWDLSVVAGSVDNTILYQVRRGSNATGSS